MTDSEYRKKLLQELASATEEQAKRDVFSMIEQGVSALESSSNEAPAYIKNDEEFQRALKIVFDVSQEPRSRMLALKAASLKIGNSELFFDNSIQVLTSNSQPPELQTAIMSILRQTSFTSSIFREKRPQIFVALRQITLDSEAPDWFREEVIYYLAMNKDESTQALLQKGLDEPATAIVEPQVAVKLLGYDIHAVNFEKLKAMLASAGPETKRAIARVISADPNSKDELLRMASDKSEDAEVRSISIAGLSSLAPNEYKDLAEKIVLDDNESDDLRAASLSGYRRAKQLADSSPLEAANASEIDKQISDIKSRAKGSFLKAVDKYLKKEE